MSLFPATRHSLLEELRGGDPQRRRAAQEALARAYLGPVRAYLAIRWRRPADEVEELGQEFFRSVAERGLLEAYRPDRARLRTYLRLCVDALVKNHQLAARREKRGGGSALLSLEEAGEQAETAAVGESPEALFEREWARSLFTLGIAALRDRCLGTPREVAFRLFERYDLEDGDSARPTYATLAAEHGLPETQVTNHLAWARREFRAAVLRRLREITASDEEFRSEARSLLGVDPR